LHQTRRGVSARAAETKGPSEAQVEKKQADREAGFVSRAVKRKCGAGSRCVTPGAHVRGMQRNAIHFPRPERLPKPLTAPRPPFLPRFRAERPFTPLPVSVAAANSAHQPGPPRATVRRHGPVIWEIPASPPRPCCNPSRAASRGSASMSSPSPNRWADRAASPPAGPSGACASLAGVPRLGRPALVSRRLADVGAAVDR
jgi:hypothetical protein